MAYYVRRVGTDPTFKVHFFFFKTSNSYEIHVLWRHRQKPRGWSPAIVMSMNLGVGLHLLFRTSAVSERAS